MTTEQAIQIIQQGNSILENLTSIKTILTDLSSATNSILAYIAFLVIIGSASLIVYFFILKPIWNLIMKGW